MKCIKCGNDLFERQLRCEKCGAFQPLEEEKKETKKKPTKQEEK